MRRQYGFISVEILVALIVISLLTVFGANQLMNHIEGLNEIEAAQQQNKVAEAVKRYVKDNYTAVYTNAGGGPVTITVPMLINTEYLPTGFSAQNIYSQTFQGIARRAGTNKLETLVVTTGGVAIPEMGIRKIAKNMGAAGGYISSQNTAIAQGATWRSALTSFGISPGAGRLATSLYFEDGAYVNDYLYRNAIPGKPELNRMNTALNMGNNDINNAKIINASRVNTDNWFVSTGNTGWLNDTWKGGWYMSDSNWVRSWGDKSVYTGGTMRAGQLESSGRTKVGEFVELQKVAVPGAACSPNGLIGRRADGQTLWCQSGIWRASSTDTVIVSNSVHGGQNTFAAVDCPANTKMISGGAGCSANWATYLRYTVPNGNGWLAVCDDYSYRPVTTIVYAVCLK